MRTRLVLSVIGIREFQPYPDTIFPRPIFQLRSIKIGLGMRIGSVRLSLSFTAVY